jgi:hypothetical protein
MALTGRQLDRMNRDWQRLKRRRDDDLEAFAGLVLSYVGPVEDPMLDGDAELRRRAKAVLDWVNKGPRPRRGK